MTTTRFQRNAQAHLYHVIAQELCLYWPQITPKNANVTNQCLVEPQQLDGGAPPVEASWPAENIDKVNK